MLNAEAATVTRAICAAKLCGALLALCHPGAALSGSSAGVTVTAIVLPTRAQRLMAARMSVRQADGTVLVLNPQQQAQYIANPGSLRNHVRGSPAEYLVVTVEY